MHTKENAEAQSRKGAEEQEKLQHNENDNENNDKQVATM
jgi:hypothetical protein